MSSAASLLATKQKNIIKREREGERKSFLLQQPPTGHRANRANRESVREREREREVKKCHYFIYIYKTSLVPTGKYQVQYKTNSADGEHFSLFH